MALYSADSVSNQDYNFRNLLRCELVARCKKNKSYSLRSFARDLQIDPSTLSKIINGRSPLTNKRIFELGMKLGMCSEEVKPYFYEEKCFDLSEEDSSPSAVTYLPEDICSIIADWTHTAIMELLHLEQFEPKVSWVAKALGISESDAKDAVDRLLRVGMLEITADGQWVSNVRFFSSTGNRFTNEDLMNVQRNVLKMSLQALDEVPWEERNHSAITMAISKEQVAEVKERTRKFRWELDDYLSRSPKKDAVYQLGISFFPLTKI